MVEVDRQSSLQAVQGRHGLGLFGTVSRVQQIARVCAVWVLPLVVSPLWLRSFQFGPLEWLWRSLT